MLYLPPRLDSAEIALLGQLERQVPVRAAFSHLDDALADRGAQEQAEALAAALGLREPGAAAAGAGPAPDVTLVSAPDPAEEVWGTARRLVADLEANEPLWQMAVLYTQPEPYGPLVREALDAAGLPWHAAEGRPVTASWAAHSLLGLLALRERRFQREAVLAWLASRPPPGGPLADADPASIPISTWDRLSRRAQVLEGPRQWVQRFERLAVRLEQEEAEQGGRPGDETIEAPRPDSAQARAIAAAITHLDAATRPPAEDAPWDAFVDWAAALRERYVSVGESWPDAERAAAEAVNAALESLRSAAVFGPTTDLRTFRDALAAALEARRIAEGVPGRGVLVGPIGAALGATFTRVHLVGLAEGALPSRPAPDPLTAGEGEPDPLGRRERRLEAERRDLLGALAAAERGVVASFARSDGAAREQRPSRWFLELVGRRLGGTVYASELARLHSPERPWLVRVQSA